MLERASEGWEGTGRGREGLGMLERASEFWRGQRRVVDGTGVLNKYQGLSFLRQAFPLRAAML